MSYRLYSVAALAPGDHLCCLYETEEEHRGLLAPFLRSGLERGEKVLYIVDARTAETVLGDLDGDAGGGVCVQDALARGQLVILSSDETYARGGVFDPAAMIELLRAETDAAVAQGYAALRVTGEMSWVLRGLPGSSELIEYEARLNEFLEGSRCLALCQYDRRCFPAQVLLDIVRTHPVVAIGIHFYDNFFYLPPGTLLSGENPAATLERWIGQLRLRRETEEALIEEAAVNAAMAELSRALISGSISIDVISDLVLAHAQRLTGSAFGLVGYVDPQTGYMVAPTITRDVWDVCRVAGKGVVFTKYGGMWGWVLDNRRPIVTNAPAEDPRSTGVPAGHLPIHRFLAVPAVVGDSLTGMVALANADRDYNGADLGFVERLASVYALALQRKRADEELLAAKEQVDHILASISDGFYALDDELVVTYFNAAAEQMLGINREEALGQPLFDVFVEARGTIFEEKYTWAVQHKAPVCFETYFDVEPYQNWYDVRVYPSQDGIAVYFQVTTERRQAEEALREAERRRDRMLQTMVDGMVMVDRTGQIVYANEGAERILELSENEIRSRHYDERKWEQIDASGERYPADRLPLAIALEERREVNGLEHGILTPDGEVKWLSVNASPLIDEHGELYGAVASFRDVTDHKRAQEALAQQASELARSNEELRQFAYVASHDLQEPLRMVSSYVQLLARRYQGRLDDDADEFINYAVDGAERMQKLIRGLLQYSRVDQAGRPFAPTDCNRVVGQVLHDLQFTIRETGAVVRCDGLPVVEGDEVQLGQLFQNLIGNALKFRGEAAPSVEILAREADSPHPTALGGGGEKRGGWLFAIRDNGIGIDPTYSERIFEIFQRLHTRTDYPGTGIGLGLCKKIVERHGGRIWVESAPGEGATFYFTLPSAKAGTAAVSMDEPGRR